jgi:hypothetical protein
MEDKLLKERFYNQIETELEFCDSNVTPLICYNFSTPDLKAGLVETIAQTCISMKMDISEAIVEVERTYSLNSTEG